MRRCLIVFVALLQMVFSDDGELCQQHEDAINCHCTDIIPDYEEIFLTAAESTKKLVFSGCSNATLGFTYLQGTLSLEKVIFRNIGMLSLQLKFPSKVTELHIDSVNLESISGETFYGDTRLHHLSVRNSAIVDIERDTFAGVAVETARFENVTFVYLDEDSLAFSFDMSSNGDNAFRRNHSVISFRGCRFPDVHFSPISVGTSGKIKFVDNLIDCTSLARVYVWIETMLVSQEDNEELLCQYLDENFCETKRDGNKLIRRLFESNVLSRDVGLKLNEACPEMYKEFLEEKKMVLGSGGQILNGGLFILVSCLGVIMLRG